MAKTHNEERFFQLFEGIFTGADIEGRADSGYVNLLRMKRKHFQHFRLGFVQQRNAILAQVGITEADDALRDELYDKLYTFFSRYFSESGAVYFRHTPAWQPIYHRVDDPGRDVIMVWKTGMLHYVKTDTLVCGMTVHLDGVLAGKAMTNFRYAFDISQLQTRQNNERRDFAFAFGGEGKDEKGKKTAVINIIPPPKGTKKDDDTKSMYEKLAKEIKQVFPNAGEEHLREAIGVFRKQTEADFFINRDAAGFLREQFELWMFQYALGGENEFTKERINQLRALRGIADLAIRFFAEFENELLRVWEKPKLARGVNYVITLDRLPPEIKQKAAAAKGANAQAKEWAEELGLTDDGVSMADIIGGNKKAKKVDAKFLPIDTKHFKELEGDMLAAIAKEYGGVDAALDGELVHSENWQALNTLAKKYRGRVKCIYIDPPFNLDDGDQFDYRTNYKDSSWATMLQGRLVLAHEFLAGDGSIFMRVGHDGNHIARFLLNNVYGEENYRNEIIVRRAEEQKGELMKQFSGMRAMMVNYDNIYWFSKNPDPRFSFITKDADEKQSRSQWHSFWKAEDRPELRYKIFNVDLSLRNSGQWMWERKRAFRAVKNYEAFLRVKDDFAGDLEKYWQEKFEPYEKDNGVKMEFIRCKNNSGKISSVEYWIPPRDRVISDNNWMDIKGYSNTTPFDTENSEALLERIINHIPAAGDMVVDFFAGSGTTMAVAQKLGRKWLGVEMGEHFDTVILPRMKKVVAGHRSGINGNGKKDKNGCQYKGGGAFRYYALEQYEESLASARYADDEPSFADAPYIFCKDEKMTWAITIKDEKLVVQLRELFADVDIAQTLSHLRGLPIAARTANSVELSDGYAVETYRTDVQTMPEEDKQKLLAALKPALWWE